MTRGIPVRPTPLLIALIALIVVGCAGNRPYRTAGLQTCAHADDCVDATIEQHEDPEHDETYDLAFVEFTERGNIFDRDQMEMVLEHVRQSANPQRGAAHEGVLVVVFVHGWKHNASPDDSNVRDFRDLLRKAARLDAGGRRKLVGVYVGWRGASISLPVIKEITYWERKSVAEQVGKGGVTELLLELERAVIDDDAPNKNLYLITGHSFGGAIVLSALNEILLERVVTAQPAKTCDTAADAACVCVESRPYGHGVVLLNPAMEANEAFQLKQAVAQRCFGRDQVRLMHVISSDADTATNLYFHYGQRLGMITWKETDLDWEANGRRLQFAESDLDITTVGNFTPFQTGQLCDGALADEQRRPECRLDNRPSRCLERSIDARWDYISYVGNEECVPQSDRQQHIPVASNEPLAFIQTDEAFIADHNDVFRDNVSAYLAAVVAEARFKRTRARGRSMADEPFPPGCVATDQDFDFGPCFHAYEAIFRRESGQPAGE